jgi:hypothetical protein
MEVSEKGKERAAAARLGPSRAAVLGLSPFGRREVYTVDVLFSIL